MRSYKLLVLSLAALVMSIGPVLADSSITVDATSLATDAATKFNTMAPVAIGIVLFFIILGLASRLLRKK